MIWKVLLLFLISTFLVIQCQKEDEEPEDLRKKFNCADNPAKWCNLNQTDSGCADGYQCHDIGIQDYAIGRCFRDQKTCHTENSPCCDSTDCCRQVSDTNTAPLDCVQTYDSKLICKVLVV